MMYIHSNETVKRTNVCKIANTSTLGDNSTAAGCKKGKCSPYSITERTVPELIPVLGSQPASDVSHKPGGRLPLLSARPAVPPATLKRAAIPILLLGEQRHNGCEQFA